MKIEKDQKYEILVFPNQDEGQKAQRFLISEGIDFKRLSSLAMVIPEARRIDLCSLLVSKDINISGYYPFVSEHLEKEYFEKAENYKPEIETGNYLNKVSLCYVAPCVADKNKIRLIGYFDRDISEIMPYLNSVIKGVVYNKKASTLTFTRERRIINLYNIKIAMSKADGIIDAWKQIDEVKALINKTYTERTNITPEHESKKKVTVLQLYGLLPKTNCRACGENACLAFAAKLLQGEQDITKCAPIQTDEKHSKNKAKIENLL